MKRKKKQYIMLLIMQMYIAFHNTCTFSLEYGKPFLSQLSISSVLAHVVWK